MRDPGSNLTQVRHIIFVTDGHFESHFFVQNIVLVIINSEKLDSLFSFFLSDDHAVVVHTVVSNVLILGEKIVAVTLVGEL